MTSGEIGKLRQISISIISNTNTMLLHIAFIFIVILYCFAR